MPTTKKNKHFLVGEFRYRKLDGKYLLSTTGGRWLFLSAEDFRRFLEGDIKKDEKIYAELAERGFVDIDRKKLAQQAADYLKLHHTVSHGTGLYMFVLTLRCNHACSYCQISPETPDAKGFDMDEETARKSVDLALRTPSRAVCIEFQGGEPLLNWPVLKYVVEYALELNKQKNKNLKFSLVSNLTLMDEEKLQFLLDHNVNICCSLDGPEEIHNKNRAYLEKGGSYAPLAKHIRMIQEAITKKREESGEVFVDSLSALTTITRYSLPHWKEIVDEYLKFGFTSIFLRPLSPFGFERRTTKIIGYEAEEFVNFYMKAVDYILELNLRGQLFVERNACYVLKKILEGNDPGFLELRSPCGAGIGQMAFNPDGRIYTCDEGRMAARMGYENFFIGNVQKSEFNDLIDNDVVKTSCISSCLESHAGCTDCVYKPYCGICPVANLTKYNTIFPQMPATDHCKTMMGIFDYLFVKARNSTYEPTWERWLAYDNYLPDQHSCPI